MRRTFRPLGMLVLFAFAACSAGDAKDTRGANSGDGGGADAAASAGGNNGGEPASTLASIAIEPALAELESVEGSRPSQQFTLVGTKSDGTKASVSGARFSLQSMAFGAISQASGEFVATGLAAGVTKVLVEAPGAGGTILKAEATVRVSVKRIVLGAGVTPDMPGRFSAARRRTRLRTSCIRSKAR